MAGLHGNFRSLPGGLTSLLTPREDFQEVEVHAGVLVLEGSTSLKLRKSKSVPPTQIPRSSSSSGDGGGRGISIPQPQPVDVPDWNKILKDEAPKEKMWDEDDDIILSGNSEDDLSGRKSHRRFHPDLFEDEDDEDMLPPHELLARRRKRNGPVAYSMCEGIGRTLKGRDLVNVRTYVLRRTGFIE